MKKRIFIAMHYMELGGAEISLIGLLQALDYSKYDVDLFIYSHQGELMQFIPKEVNLLHEIPAYAYIEKPMKEALLHGHIGVIAARLWAKWQFKRYLRRIGKTESAAVFQYIGNTVTKVLPSLYKYGEYDLAISYLNPHNIVRDKVLAKKKICWIHTDYTQIDINVEQELPIWASFDHIISISPDVTKSFVQVFPSLKDRIVEMENILSPNFVRSRAEEFEVDFNDNVNDNENPDEIKYINLLSVGRFCEAKNYDNVPDICSRINSKLATDSKHYTLNSKLSIRWYLIGWGGDEQLIRQKIVESGMEEIVIILGKKSNPYPYIKACDIYVQPSRYEGKSVTVREAQMLCKPVVVTDYPTASSQIQDDVDGVIVPLDNERCAKGIADFILYKEQQKRITEYLYTHDYGNLEEVKKIDKLLE